MKKYGYETFEELQKDYSQKLYIKDSNFKTRVEFIK